MVKIINIAERIQRGLNGIYKVEYIMGIRVLKMKINGFKYGLRYIKSTRLPEIMLCVESVSHFDMRLLFAFLYILDEVTHLYFKYNGLYFDMYYKSNESNITVVGLSSGSSYFNNIPFIIDEFCGKQIIYSQTYDNDISYITNYLSETQLRLFKAYKAYRRDPILFDYNNDSWNNRKYPIIYQYL